MKFGDKLIILRKKKGLSQEELAEKLNVSRQSVSKWESNNTYPETDKIISICNIFNCSMDDLINEKISEVGEISKNNNEVISNSIDSLLNFISKTVNMASHMTFLSGLKCIIELSIILGLFVLIGNITISIFTGIIYNAFSFIDGFYLINNIIKGILGIILFILSIIVLIHIFKIRYLNYYENEINNNNSNIKDKKIQIKKENKIIVRDEKEDQFAFLNILSRIVIYFIKFIVFWILVSMIFITILLVASTVVLISIVFTNLMIFGITLTFIFSVVISILIDDVLIKFIFNKKINSKISLIILLVSIIMIGIGAGITTIGLKNMNISDKKLNLTEKYENVLEYNDKLILYSRYNDITYIKNNDLEDNKIKLKVNYDKNFTKIELLNSEEDQMNIINISPESTYNFSDLYNIIINDLKNNIIPSYDTESIEISVEANETTINKLIENTNKVYIYNREDKDNKIIITNYEDKVVVNSDYCEWSYNAINEELMLVDDKCKCERKTYNTSKGEIIKYDCNYKNEDE